MLKCPIWQNRDPGCVLSALTCCFIKQKVFSINLFMNCCALCLDTNSFQVKWLTIENILTFFHIKCFWSDSFLTENGRKLGFSQDVSPTEINQCWKYFEFVYLKAFASLNAAESGSRVNYSISLVPGAQLQVFFTFFTGLSSWKFQEHFVDI